MTLRIDGVSDPEGKPLTRGSVLIVEYVLSACCGANLILCVRLIYLATTSARSIPPADALRI